MEKYNKHITEGKLSLEDLEQIGNILNPYGNNSLSIEQLLETLKFNFNQPILPEKLKTELELKEETKLNMIINYINNDLFFKSALQSIAKIHDQIVDMYTNTLFEDNWSKSTVEIFNSLLDEYNKDLEYVKNNISKVEWKSEKLKSQFMKLYNDVIEADAKAWNRVLVRNNNYLRYRTNRKSIILQIADIIGTLKNTKDGNYQDIFRYYNNKCANIKLYDNTDKSEKKEYLSVWFKPNLNKIIDELSDSKIISGSVDAVVLSKIFRIYVNCRKMAYAIFNLMTSNSEYNGYDKWHNRLVDYCDATLNDRQMEILINAASSEGQFEDIDDYQNIMDEESWENKGINESFNFNNVNESWFDEGLEYYQSDKERFNKSKVSKINMIPTNANQCKVSCDGKHVYANTNFYPGDIIEICPTKRIDKSSMYSKDMRDVVFEVVPNLEWVLPFGYCRYYLNDNIENQGNCTYIWDPIKQVIVIKAINKIPKFEKLLLLF